MFLIYPSLPRNDDLNLLLEAAVVAWEEKRGAWAAFGEDLLLGYEFRAAIKLGIKKLEDPAAAIADAYQRLPRPPRPLAPGLGGGSADGRSTPVAALVVGG